MKRAAPRPAGLALVAVVVLVAGSLAACGGDDDSAGDADGGGGLSEDGSDGDVPDDVVVIDTDPAEVTALDNSFRPENIQVAAGTEVVWTNKGRNEHNALPIDGGDWGVEIEDFGPGAVYRHTFDEPGVYRYYCSIHGTEDAGMIGTVVVTD